MIKVRQNRLQWLEVRSRVLSSILDSDDSLLCGLGFFLYSQIISSVVLALVSTWYVISRQDVDTVGHFLTLARPTCACLSSAPSFFPGINRSLLLLTLATGADINSSYTLGHSLSCFLVMVWSRKFAGSRVRTDMKLTTFPLPPWALVSPACDPKCRKQRCPVDCQKQYKLVARLSRSISLSVSRPRNQVNVLEMFELSTELLPYFFVAQTLMMEGVIPWVDLSGLLIGYAWEVCSLSVRMLTLFARILSFGSPLHETNLRDRVTYINSWCHLLGVTSHTKAGSVDVVTRRSCPNSRFVVLMVC